MGRLTVGGGADRVGAEVADRRPSHGRGRHGEWWRGACRGDGGGADRGGSRRAGRRACRDTVGRHLARRGEGRRERRPRCRFGRRVRDARGACRAAERGGRLLARRDDGRLAAAYGPGGPDRDQGRTRPVHRVRHQRRDPAHRRLQGREEDPRHQLRRGGADPRERRLRGHRRPRRGGPRDHGRAEKGAVLIDVVLGALALAALLAVCGTLFYRRAKLLVSLIRLGKPVARFEDVPTRVRNEAVIVLGQRKLLQRLVPGLIHAAIFWGFLVLFPTILIAMIGAVDKHSTLPWLGHQGWFAFVVDLFAVLVLAGVVGALIIRKVQRPARFEGSHLGEADLILGLIAGIVTTLLLWHASRIALGLNEWPEGSSPVSNALSNLFGDGSATEVLERAFVWAHILIILSFLAYLPHSKHL